MSDINMSTASMDWQRFRHTLFCAEFTVKDDDIVYHFFPPEEHRTFDDAGMFAKKVERAFKRKFPASADIRADFVRGRVVEKIREANGDTRDIPIDIAPMGEDRPPQDTWHITAKGWGARPGVIQYAGHNLMQDIAQEMMLVSQ